MLNIYLLRHGETPYNAEGNRYCGRTDIGLTDIGVAQAKAVNQRLAGLHIDAVYSSPLQRARVTAELATDREVETDQRIIEIDFGEWEGKTQLEFAADDPLSWEAWANDPGENRAGRTGETGNQIVKRVDAFYQDMLRKHADQAIVVVGHNGINRLYMAYKLGMHLKNYRRIFQENSAITLIQLDGNGELTLKKLNA
ncbi:MAG: Phosphoglycerate mutase [Mucilaginibacter sp.]|uniref:histidine phosphatase family protein n=1 Tax=Mucilaginibacter sp. TaxID=1882438 RepID=UPI00262BABEF|nr:histidine phosphatase family protein [Mucilaginibacter sp.]MDB5002059.1 Phosphoglycerate mutase [Mucilaginibacter sp.]